MKQIGVAAVIRVGAGRDAEERNGVCVMEVKSKWRGFDVSIVAGLPDAFLIDEPQRRLLIRRSLFRPWRMLWALVDAMNELAGRDDAWATKRNGKSFGIEGEPVLLCGKPWRITACSVLGEVDRGDGSISLKAVDVDWDKREVRVCSRFNLGFGAAALAEAIGDICNDGAFEAFELAHDRLSGRLTSAAVAADVAAMTANEKSERSAA